MIIVALIGLKKCGKTTSAEALISGFRERGLKVGGVKFMPNSSFTIDREGKDTWRQKQAGADFVVSISKNEMAYIEKREERATLADVLKLIPADTDILICEGLNEDHPDIRRVILAKSVDKLEETFEVRGIGTCVKNVGVGKHEHARIIALSGIMTNEMLVNEVAVNRMAANEVKEYQDYPVFNCSTKEGTQGLIELILQNG